LQKLLFFCFVTSLFLCGKIHIQEINLKVHKMFYFHLLFVINIKNCACDYVRAFKINLIFFFYGRTPQESQLLPNICSQWDYGIPNSGMLWCWRRWGWGRWGSAWIFRSSHQTRLKPFQATFGFWMVVLHQGDTGSIYHSKINIYFSYNHFINSWWKRKGPYCPGALYAIKSKSQKSL